jgi:hypothetical protein
MVKNPNTFEETLANLIQIQERILHEQERQNRLQEQILSELEMGSALSWQLADEHT